MKSSKAQLNRSRFILMGLSLAGLLASFYSLFIELQHDKDHSYRAACDISEKLSCSAAFLSEYGRGMGIMPSDSIFYIRNPYFGFATYTILFILSILCLKHKWCLNIIYYNSIFLNMTTIYLAYLLIFKIRSLCVVCLTIYVINFLLLIFSSKLRATIKKLVSNKKQN
ncbi:vitamin-K epoxide reductase [Brevipalpus obovatus]|uniref:vitamin-K epoxide reductase n=1 Tax=Brevipalpus obovatus TaxID=246614 RepID=UPI003D9F935A